MKMDDVQVGEVYGIGRHGGSKGVQTTGQRGRVVEKGESVNIGRYSFKPKPGVRLVLLDSEGNERTHADTDWNRSRKIVGTPIYKDVTAALVLSLAEIQKREDKAQAEQAERERRMKLLTDYRAEITQLIVSLMPIQEDEFQVQVSYEQATDSARLNRISFANTYSTDYPSGVTKQTEHGADSLLQFLRSL
jgi:hypothetical protein